MCRLYGQISPTIQNARDLLVDSSHSLLRQSNFRPGNFQKDGWGFGYYEGPRVKIIKSEKPAFEESKRFNSAAARIRSRIVIGHLRAASNPRGLPYKRLISVANSQPFSDGHFLFAHNGTVNIPLEIAKFLGPYQRHIRGINDSEVYFWQFRKFYDVYRDIPKALQACIQEMWILWNDCGMRYPGKKGPYTSLNTLVSDGKSLHAMCHRIGKAKQRSLFNSHQAWSTMSRAKRGGRFVLASEDMDGRRWKHFNDHEICSVTLSNSGLSMRRQEFKVGSI